MGRPAKLFAALFQPVPVRRLTMTAYRLSFTTASLAHVESMRLVQLLLDRGWEITRQLVATEDVLQKGNQRTSNHQAVELLARLAKLPPALLEALPKLDTEAQRQLLFVGICLTFQFIADFVTEVVMLKLQLHSRQLYESDYRAFVEQKRESHPELTRLTENTQKKLRQVLFKMLEQVGLLKSTREKELQPLLVHSQVRNLLEQHLPEALLYVGVSGPHSR